MTDVKARLTEAADYLDYLYEGSKHIPAEAFHDKHRRGVVRAFQADPHSPEPAALVAQFFYGGAADVFLALGPGALPLLSALLRHEAADVAMCDAINERDPDNDGKTRVLYRDATSSAMALAAYILKAKDQADG